MKLIIAGSTGYVGTEVLHQALSNPAITSIIALARRSTPVHAFEASGTDTTKLKIVICENFTDYSEDVKKELKGTDACIWLIAITRSKVPTTPFDKVRNICLDYTIRGLETLSHLSSKTNPFRFIYVSGSNATRDQGKKPWLMPEYSLLRGEIENRILSYAAGSQGAVECCIAKPGLITSPDKGALTGGILTFVLRLVFSVPQVERSQIAAALIEQAVNGIEKETLLNSDLVRIGTKVIAELEDLDA